MLSCFMANAQQQKITTKDYNLIGKVKSVLETAEKQGELLTEKEKNDKTTFYSDVLYPIIGQYIFNKEGNIIEKRGFPNIDKKTIYEYDASNVLIAETIYASKLGRKKSKPLMKVKYTHKRDTIIATKTNLEDKTEENLVITQVYKNNQLTLEYNAQKSISYNYDSKGTLIKKEGTRERNNQKNSENYEIKYENDMMISKFCQENNTLETYYPNGLLKSYKREFRFQENVYTYDQNGNWITSTVTIDGKPSVKYSRKIDYFE